MRENNLYERLKDDGDDDGENVHDRPRGVEPYLYSDRAKNIEARYYIRPKGDSKIRMSSLHMRQCSSLIIHFWNTASRGHARECH